MHVGAYPSQRRFHQALACTYVWIHGAGHGLFWFEVGVTGFPIRVTWVDWLHRLVVAGGIHILPLIVSSQNLSLGV